MATFNGIDNPYLDPETHKPIPQFKAEARGWEACFESISNKGIRVTKGIKAEQIMKLIREFKRTAKQQYLIITKVEV